MEEKNPAFKTQRSDFVVEIRKENREAMFIKKRKPQPQKMEEEDRHGSSVVIVDDKYSMAVRE